jgi:hypothetical protein
MVLTLQENVRQAWAYCTKICSIKGGANITRALKWTWAGEDERRYSRGAAYNKATRQLRYLLRSERTHNIKELCIFFRCKTRPRNSFTAQTINSHRNWPTYSLDAQNIWNEPITSQEAALGSMETTLSTQLALNGFVCKCFICEK